MAGARAIVATVGVMASFFFCHVVSAEPPTLQSPEKISAWATSDFAGGFRKGITDLGITLGAARGQRIFGGSSEHDFLFLSLHGGKMLSGLVGGGHWYRGNWELHGELFNAWQIEPTDAYLVGVNGALRYNFITGTRWVPFFEAGAGPSLTNIKGPDLSTHFEFNLQAATGVHYFLSRDLALTMEGKLFHISNAGISSPNLGVNSIFVSLGLSWFF